MPFWACRRKHHLAVHVHQGRHCLQMPKVNPRIPLGPTWKVLHFNKFNWHVFNFCHRLGHKGNKVMHHLWRRIAAALRENTIKAKLKSYSGNTRPGLMLHVKKCQSSPIRLVYPCIKSRSGFKIDASKTENDSRSFNGTFASLSRNLSFLWWFLIMYYYLARSR